ncbi:large ribosomal subunit protein uL23m isoform 2-T2 [Dugong dugon]
MAQPEDTVQFRIPLEMTRVDLRNYLERIYQVPVAAVRTRVQHGSGRRRDHRQVRVKKPDYKVAYVQLKRRKRVPALCKPICASSYHAYRRRLSWPSLALRAMPTDRPSGSPTCFRRRSRALSAVPTWTCRTSLWSSSGRAATPDAAASLPGSACDRDPDSPGTWVAPIKVLLDRK